MLVAANRTADLSESGESGNIPALTKRMGLSSPWAAGLLESVHSGGCATSWAAGCPTQTVAQATARKKIKQLQLSLDQCRWNLRIEKPSC